MYLVYFCFVLSNTLWLKCIGMIDHYSKFHNLQPGSKHAFLFSAQDQTSEESRFLGFQICHRRILIMIDEERFFAN